MSKQVLVTGAAGFVGRNLITRLAYEGYEVLGLDIQPDAPDLFDDLDGVNYVHGSILDENFLDNTVLTPANDFNIVFHLAAVVGVSRYVGTRDPLYVMEVNIDGTKNILERIRDNDTRLVYTSTSEIYGKNPKTPWTEADDQVLGPPTLSRWSYSVSKSTCEHMIHMLTNTDAEVSATVVRPFNLYGPHQRPDFVVPKFVEAVVNGSVPQVYGTGEQTRCFTYVEDFVEALVTAAGADAARNEVFNLGSTDEVSIEELAHLVLDVTENGEKSPEYVEMEEVYDEDYEEPEKRVPDVSKAKSKLDWQATTSLEEGVRRTYEWYESSGGR